MDIQSEKQPWRRTKVNWETKKVIWERWASDDTQDKTVKYFELNRDKFPKGPCHRNTIGKVRKELLEMPHEWLIKLINELPGIYGFIREKRPDYIGDIRGTQSDYDSKLSIALLIIASNLEKIRNTPLKSLGDPLGRQEYTVEEEVYGGWWTYEGQAKLGDVDKSLAAELLARLKEEGEFPELADISDWAELKETHNTEDFIQRLIARAHRGNF